MVIWIIVVVREIWQIDGGIHGNEPTGPEAALWFATELCGEYGENEYIV